MKKFILVPILALSLAAVGCGKKNSDEQTSGGVVVQPQPQPLPTPIPLPTGPNPTFLQTCQGLTGTVIVSNSQNICQFNQGGNISYAGIGNIQVASGIYAYPYGHIFINASQNMKVYVNGVYIGKGQVLTNGGSYGQISFSGDSLFDSYSVHAIQVTSAFNEAGQYVAF